MNHKYILITAARNEEAYIEKTINSVISQSVLPIKWIIVSDASVDRTDEIVESYVKEHSFIQFEKSSGDKERNFGSKAKAIMFAYSLTKELNFDYIGNLDADISFESDYYKNLLDRVSSDKQLGIAGGMRFDFFRGKFKKVHCAPDSVGGPFQFFRKECFEQVGGYKSLLFGGIDIVAEVTAKMYGWKVQPYSDLTLYHHRRTGSGGDNLLKNYAYQGFKLHSLGYNSISVLYKFSRLLFEKPIFVGFLTSLSAYYLAKIKKNKIQVSEEFVKHLNNEQKEKMKFVFQKVFSKFFSK